MKKLIIARHGSKYQDKLEASDRKQAKILLAKLKEVIDDKQSIVLFCSPAPWTNKFANLLSKGLHIAPIINELFLSKAGSKLKLGHCLILGCF